MKDQCEWPRCRREPCMEYIGKSLCGEHWHRIANSESFTDDEAEALAMILLKRLRDGEVVAL